MFGAQKAYADQYFVHALSRTNLCLCEFFNWNVADDGIHIRVKIHLPAGRGFEVPIAPNLQPKYVAQKVCTHSNLQHKASHLLGQPRSHIPTPA